MDLTPKKHSGTKNELIATVWLLQQGFDVFRNVSPHGEIDIIAFRDGEVIYFDVKATQYNVRGEPSPYGNRLTARQIELGVKRLNVYWDGHCEVVEDATTFMAAMSQRRHCSQCGEMFAPREERQIFCTKQCSQLHHYIKRTGKIPKKHR
jgi:hypothetical protein